MYRPYRGIGLPACLLALLLSWCVGFPADNAMAHAALESSDPAANSILDEAPTSVSMRFTEPLESEFSSVKLVDQTGSAVAGVVSSVDTGDPYRMTATFANPLADGTYVVRWQTLSAADGHGLEGFFTFSVGGSTQPVPETSGNDSGPPEWFVVFGKWLLYVGLALAAGLWPFWLATRRKGPAGWASIELFSDRRLLISGLLTLVVGSALTLHNQAWQAAPSTDSWNRIQATITDTRYGELWLYRLGALALFLVLSFLAIRKASSLLALAALVSVLLALLTISEMSHASAQTVGRAGALMTDWLHLTAAMVWAGGLAFLAATVRNRSVDVGSMVRRFSMLAIACWVILALTGSYSAWIQVGSRDGLTDTSYGKTLLLKLALLVPVLVLAALNLLVLSPRLSGGGRRTLVHFRLSTAVELALVVSVLLTVGRLVGTQPGHDALASRAPSGIQIPVLANGHELNLDIAPGGPGPNTYAVSGEDIPPDAKVEVVLRITPPGESDPQKDIKLTRVTDFRFEGSGMELALVGDWGIEVIVRQIGTFQWQGDALVPIETIEATNAQPNGWRFDSTGAFGMLMVATAIVLAAFSSVVSSPRRRLVHCGIVLLAVAGILLMIVGRIEVI